MQVLHGFQKMQFRINGFARELKEKLEENQEDRTKGMLLTATMTEIKGGTSHNVTPKECETIFDIRIPVDMNCKY